jgi:phage terminase Nu1 subunit (DNA packaging protein)
VLTAAALAAALGISERQVQRLRAAGMPSLPIGSRGKRYDVEECKRWLREQKCQSERPPQADTKSLSPSAVDAYTAAFRRAHLRVLPDRSKLNS